MAGGEGKMRYNNLCSKIVMFSVILYFLTGLIVTDLAISYEFIDWERGAVGYELALMDAEDGEKPLILYFQTDGSEWCQKMNDNYFAVYEIEEFLINIPKAEINPEKGDPEGNLADKYGVKEYPAFFVFIPSLKTKPERIHPFSKDHNMTVDEFLKTLKDIIVYQYNEKAYAFFEKKEYEKAIKYFQLGLEFDPERAYIYYAMGIVYHTMGHEKNDSKLIGIAEEHYKKALELDPNHKESKVELEKLHQDREKRGIKPKR